MSDASTPRRRYAGRWTPFKKEMLERLHAEGLSWPEIAVRMGHPKNSCQSTLAGIRRKRRREGGEQPKRRAGASEPMQAPTLPQIAKEPNGRTFRTSIMVEDAELRARIAVQGPNGLLGDPLPGRSALDQKRQAEGVSP